MRMQNKKTQRRGGLIDGAITVTVPKLTSSADASPLLQVVPHWSRFRSAVSLQNRFNLIYLLLSLVAPIIFVDNVGSFPLSSFTHSI